MPTPGIFLHAYTALPAPKVTARMVMGSGLVVMGSWSWGHGHGVRPLLYTSQADPSTADPACPVRSRPESATPVAARLRHAWRPAPAADYMSNSNNGSAVSPKKPNVKVAHHLGVASDPDLPAAEFILEPRIRALGLATFLVALRLSRVELDFLPAQPWLAAPFQPAHRDGQNAPR